MAEGITEIVIRVAIDDAWKKVIAKFDGEIERIAVAFIARNRWRQAHREYRKGGETQKIEYRSGGVNMRAAITSGGPQVEVKTVAGVTNLSGEWRVYVMIMNTIMAARIKQGTNDRSKWRREIELARADRLENDNTRRL